MAEYVHATLAVDLAQFIQVDAHVELYVHAGQFVHADVFQSVEYFQAAHTLHVFPFI